MTKPFSIAIVGLGKIARDQHVPCIAGSDSFELVAVASPHNRHDTLPSHPDLGALLKATRNLSAVALCTTPQARFETASLALAQGCHVLLEKPPGMTVSEVQILIGLARSKGVALHASWHSRHANGVEPARAWLATRKVRSVSVVWKEDVRVWHPGQTWIWQAGGLGVFDPGINALSILTHIMPEPLILKDAELAVPENCETPIAVRMNLNSTSGATVHTDFDFLHTGEARWDIEVETDRGRLSLHHGGSEMRVDGQPVELAHDQEYARLYAHFATVVRGRRIDVDLAPFELVADAFMCGRRVSAPPFTP